MGLPATRKGRVIQPQAFLKFLIGQVVFEFHFPGETKSAKKFAKIATGTTTKKQPNMAEIRGCLMHPTVNEAFKFLKILVNKNS